MARIGWFLLGALISLGLMHFVGPDRGDAAKSTGTGTGAHPSPRWRGGPTATTPTHPDPGHAPKAEGEPAREPMRPRKTMKPRASADMAGTWNDADGLITLELREDGTYLYAGLPGEWLDTWPLTVDATARHGRPPILGPERPGPKPGYAQPHAGRWRFVDDRLTLEPARAIRSSHVSFEWDATERTLFVRFLGVQPGHLHGVTLERLVGQ